MLNRYSNVLRKQSEESNFWPTFTDLLSSILLFIVVFMLIINAIKTIELEIKTEEVNSQAAKIEEIEQQLEYVRGIGESIGNKLVAEFENSGLSLVVDAETGSIKFSGDIFFDTDRTDLKPEFKRQLNEFVPQYLGILLSEEYKNYIAEIIVEGHTDNIDSYMYNLNLSQGRAYSVVRYILSDEFTGFDNKDELLPIITANGRSWSELIYNNDGSVNQVASRRVEFKFRLKDYEKLSEILKSNDLNLN